MDEYIERELAIEALSIGEGCGNVCRRAIERILAADVAPVVRCMDCKYSYEDLGGLCCSYGPCVDCPVPPDFWCANGRRREDSHAQD